MEHTASIERPFLTSGTPVALRHALAGVSTATWLLMVQTVCVIVRAQIAFGSGLNGALICAGILAAVAGIYHGLTWSRKGNALRGGNCAGVSMVALLFWTAQVFLSQIPLFN